MPEAKKDLSELVEVDPSRIDRVKSPASGFPVLIMKSAAANSAAGESPESATSGRATELGDNNPMSDPASKEADVTETPAPTTEPPVTPDAPVEKSIDERIAEAVAKQVAPLVEANKGLEAELTALKNRPLPGGPSITAAKAAATVTTDAEAERFERLSKEVNDRDLARYYADRAKEAREASK
jgi:hypothetical protein